MAKFHIISTFAFYQKIKNLLGKASFTQTLEQEYHRLDLWYFVSFMAGIVYYFSVFTEPSIDIIIAISATLVIAYYFIHRLSIRFIILLLVFFIFGMIVAQYRTLDLEIVRLEKPIIVNITGEIRAIKPVERGTQLVLRVNKINLKQKLVGQKVKINVADKFLSDFHLHDEINITAKLFNLSDSLLPYSYNFGFYLYLDGVQASGYGLNKMKILRSIQSSASHIDKIRRIIYNRLLAAGGRDIGNFIAALLLGETKAIERDLLQNMRLAGISHILCVSGLHLSLVTMLIFGSTRFLLNLSNYISFKYNVKLISASLSLIAGYIYLELSGVQIAATRAFIMTVIFIISLMLGRKTHLLRTLGIAAILIIARNPEYIFFPAFELSFIAVLSLIAGFEFYTKHKQVLGGSYGLIGQIKFYLISNIYSSFLASIVTAPIVINQFYIFSSYSVLNNLFAVPIMSFFLMPLCIIILLTMLLNLEWIVVKITGWFIKILISLVYYSNSLPGAIWYFGNITKNSLLIFLFGFFWLCIWQTKIRIWGIIIILFSFTLMFLTPKADFIFDYQLHALGMKGKDNMLEIYANHMSKFTSNYWANWYGQKGVKITPVGSQQLFTNNSGKILSINRKNTICKDADIQINLDKFCPGKYLEIDKNFLQKAKKIVIYCGKNSCRLEYEINRLMP